MKTPTLAIVVVIIVAIIGLGWWWTAGAPTIPAPMGDTTGAGGTSLTEEEGGTPTNDTPGASIDVGASVSAYTVRYTQNGFEPKTITVPVGTTVTFVNQSSGAMWIGADEHPTHTEYDTTNKNTHCAAGYTGPVPFDQCGNGNSYTFTFTKAGSFDYHNHMAAQFGGTVVVK